ncbi:PAS domain-containing protein [Methylobacterium oxalidis]|uniref:PAS domain-containing protein n=1 Tax=Methylobacterium oxalidis TaxID=944322 RepID=UPI0033154CE2
MIFTTNAAGTLAYLSPGWGEITGQDARSAANYGWVQAVHPEDAELVRALVARAIAEGREFSCRYRLIDIDGRPVWVAAAAMPRLDPHRGSFLGFLGCVNEILDSGTRADGLVGRLLPPPAGLSRLPPSRQEIAAEHILAAQARTLQASSRSARKAVELAAFEVSRQLAHGLDGVASADIH